jgi:hypothetical protein
MFRLKSLGLACALSLALLAPVFAAMEPDNVAAEVEDAAKSCREMGGAPNTDAMLKADDLNGDGAEDWIVDYKKLQCAGTPNPFCGSGGCMLQIFLWSGGSTWTKAFDDTVQSYRFINSGGQRALEVKFSGSACGKVNAQSCPKTYRFQRGNLVPVK